MVSLLKRLIKLASVFILAMPLHLKPVNLDTVPRCCYKSLTKIPTNFYSKENKLFFDDNNKHLAKNYAKCLKIINTWIRKKPLAKLSLNDIHYINRVLNKQANVPARLPDLSLRTNYGYREKSNYNLTEQDYSCYLDMKKKYSEYTQKPLKLCSFHSTLSKDDQKVLQKIVLITPAPKKISKQLVQVINAVKKNLTSRHPLEIASYLHHEIVRIDPYKNYTLQTAHLLMNFVLMKCGYNPIVCHSIQAYNDAIGKAFESPKSFSQFIAQKLIAQKRKKYTYNELIKIGACSNTKAKKELFNRINQLNIARKTKKYMHIETTKK